MGHWCKTNDQGEPNGARCVFRSWEKQPHLLRERPVASEEGDETCQDTSASLGLTRQGVASPSGTALPSSELGFLPGQCCFSSLQLRTVFKNFAIALVHVCM